MRDRVAHDARERGDGIGRQRGIDRCHGLTHGRRLLHGIAVGLRHDPHRAEHSLLERHVHRRLWARSQALVSNASDDPDDLVEAVGAVADVDSAADGIFVGKVAIDERFVDHRDHRRLLDVLTGEGASALHGDVQRSKIVRAHRSIVRGGRRVRLRRRPSLDVERQHVVPPHGNRLHHAGGAHLRQRAEPREERIEERHPIVLLGIGPVRERDAERQHVLRTEARVHAGDPAEAAEQQHGAHQQDDRERHFGDHQTVPQQSSARRDRRSPALFEDLPDPRPRGVPGGREAEDHPGEKRHPERKGKHAAVDPMSLTRGMLPALIA